MLPRYTYVGLVTMLVIVVVGVIVVVVRTVCFEIVAQLQAELMIDAAEYRLKQVGFAIACLSNNSCSSSLFQAPAFPV